MPKRARRSANRWTLVIHGGAGALRAGGLGSERERAIHAALREVLESGGHALAGGSSALDVVEQAVRGLEDSPLFNAGRGSVLNSKARHELEAAIMDGRDLRAGAVALLRRIKNPVSLARLVMERTPHVYLAGDGAEAFAAAVGAPRVSPRYFRVDGRLEALQRARSVKRFESGFGTVGAVALDRRGNLAAATSTGGMTNKLPGRVGDSSVIAAGTYASNASCAVSCTGHGEYFIRAAVAHEICALVEHRALDVRRAAETVVHRRLARLGGRGGVIVVDRAGAAACVFNTDAMYRGTVAHDAAAVTAIGRRGAGARRKSVRRRADGG